MRFFARENITRQFPAGRQNSANRCIRPANVGRFCEPEKSAWRTVCAALRKIKLFRQIHYSNIEVEMVAPFQGMLSFFRFLRTKRRPGELREKRKQTFCILKRKTKRLKKVRLREGSFPKGGTIYLKTCTQQVVSILHLALMCGGAFWLFKHNQRLHYSAVFAVLRWPRVTETSICELLRKMVSVTVSPTLNLLTAM